MILNREEETKHFSPLPWTERIVFLVAAENDSFIVINKWLNNEM